MALGNPAEQVGDRDQFEPQLPDCLEMAGGGVDGDHGCAVRRGRADRLPVRRDQYRDLSPCQAAVTSSAGPYPVAASWTARSTSSVGSGHPIASGDGL